MAKPKILYIEAQIKDFEPLNKAALARLPKKIVLLYSIQYKPLAIAIRDYLKAHSYYIYAFKQVLGCSKLSAKEKALPVLLVGSGRFHALNLAMQTTEAIYIYNNAGLEKVSQSDINKLKQKKQVALAKFFSADKIGILVSTKPGQNRLADAKALKKKLKGEGKSAYILISNNINLEDLENFNMDFFVNTACSGLVLDSNKVVNIDDLPTVNSS